MSYPRPNAVSTRLITAINSSIANIHSALLSQIPFRVSMQTEGHSPYRGGLAAYHPGSPKGLPHFDRDLNRIHFGAGKVAGSIFNIVLTSQRYNKNWKILILSGFQSKCPLFELDKSYYMGLYFLCFHRHNIRKFINISPAIWGR